MFVSLRTYNDKYELIVQDNGIRLPNDIDFENTESLGLQFVNSLVGQLDGYIEVDRSEGTTFKIIFSELEYKERI